MDIASLNDLIQVKRRTVKPHQFNDKEIDKAIIENILENANWAPTHGITQPWAFTVIQGNARQELADFLSSLYKELTPEGEFLEGKYEKLRVNPIKAPCIISLSMKRGKNVKIPELEEIEAAAIAAQNMMLTAAAYGLGSFFSTPKIIYKEEAKSFLSLGEDDLWLGLLYFGYTDKQIPQARRRPIEEFVEWRF